MTAIIETERRTGAAPLAAVRPWTIAIAFGLVATAVSATGSWIPSLWGDEAASVMSAQRPVGSLLNMLLHVDAVHGFYYLGLHGWIRLVGESAFAIRFPSAVAIGFAVAAITLLAGRRGGPAAAIAAGIVGAVLPRMTYAGEEARSFAFSAAAAAWLTLLFVWLVDGRGRTVPASVRRTCWLLYGAGMAVASYMFLYMITLALGHLAVLLLTRASRRTLVSWALAMAGTALAITPIALLAFFERRQIGYLGAQTLDPSTLLYAPWFSTPWVAAVAWALILLAVGGSIAAWRRAGIHLRAGVPVTATTVAFCWLIVPTGALLLANLVFPLYTARYSTFAAPAAALLVAEGILVLGRWIARSEPRRAVILSGVGLLGFVAVCAPVYQLQRGPYAKNNSDWSEVSAAMGAVAKPGDAVVFDESTRPSQRPRLAMHTYPAGFVNVRDVTLETPYSENVGWADRAYGVKDAAERGRFDDVDRVWLIENDVDGNLRDYGREALTELGFEPTGRIVTTHRTAIIELTR
ncbi:glycosyltransferase family 39 protein [Leifsonia aquatica]|uniref:glycosyltransferase family 39 protein n=1 Tax=Leifsonia aquatica TaxID=144185 RepID=UPI0038201A99